jgi:hypothetical protein
VVRQYDGHAGTVVSCKETAEALAQRRFTVECAGGSHLWILIVRDAEFGERDAAITVIVEDV